MVANYKTGLMTVWIWILFGIPVLAYSQERNDSAVEIDRDENKNLFDRYGLSDDIAKLGISSLTHGENILQHVERILTLDGEIKRSEVFLIQSTDAKGIIDLRVKYRPRDLEEDHDFIDRLEKLTKTEYLLKSYSKSYDRKSVEVFEQSNGDVEIHFDYAAYQLPQTIAYFRFMKVVLTVRDGRPVQMIISSSKPFDYENGFKAEEYTQVVTFGLLSNGKTIVREKQIVAKGVRKGKPARLETRIKTIAFYEDDEETIILDQDLVARASDPRLREEKIELTRPLPLMADMVRRRGIDVPLPYGVALSYRNQTMDLGFTGFNIMDVNLDEFFDPGESIGNIRAQSATLRGTVTVLPFWSVFGLAGKIDVDAEVDAQYTGAIEDLLVERFGRLGAAAICRAAVAAGLDICSPGRVLVPIKLNYNMLGLGTTLSVGYRQFFASCTGSYTRTTREGSINWNDGVATLQPMVGYQFLQYRAQLLVGAEYQGLKYSMSGNLGYIPEIDREFTYDVGVELNRWAFLAGFNKQVGKHFNITGFYNRGETRESFTVNVGYNW